MGYGTDSIGKPNDLNTGRVGGRVPKKSPNNPPKPFEPLTPDQSAPAQTGFSAAMRTGNPAETGKSAHINRIVGSMDEGEAGQLKAIDDMREGHGQRLTDDLEASRGEQARAARQSGNMRAAYGGSTMGGGQESSNRQLTLDSMRMRQAIRNQSGDEMVQYGRDEIRVRGENLNRKMAYLNKQIDWAISNEKDDLAYRLQQMSDNIQERLLELELESDSANLNSDNP